MRFQLFAELRFYYCTKMVTKLQSFCRQWFARIELRKRMSLALSRLVLEHHAVRIIQSRLRGMAGRRIAHCERLMLMERNSAATLIQRTFRGSQVLHWSQLKWNALSCHVQQRANVELDKAMKMRQALSNVPLGNKTAEVSEDEVQCAKDNNNNVEVLTHAFGESYVGAQCLIYWPDGIYRPVDIVGYDKRIRLWQLAYEDDDSEWLNLVREHDRVLIKNGHDWIPFCYFHTPQLAMYLMKRDALHTSRKEQLKKSPSLSYEKQESDASFAPTQHEDHRCPDGVAVAADGNQAIESDINSTKEKVYSDLWLSSYVARDLILHKRIKGIDRETSQCKCC
jgi:hypothetical protein